MAQVSHFSRPFKKRHRPTKVTRSFVLDNGFQFWPQQPFKAHAYPPGTKPGISQSSPGLGSFPETVWEFPHGAESEDKRNFREGRRKRSPP